MQASLICRSVSYSGRPIAALCLALTVLPMAVEGAFRIRTTTLSGNRYLLFRDVARFYGMQYHVHDETVVCRSRYSRLVFRTNDRVATLNGIQVLLSLPVGETGSEVFLSETDFLLTVDPLLRRKVLDRKPVRTVVIDPGHGGRDPGAVAGGIREKDINLRVARLVAGILRRHGVQAYLTRGSDSGLTLSERTAAARRFNCDLLISLHANSAGSRSARGVETYALTPRGTASTHSSEIKERASPGNLHDRNNMRLAYEMQRYLRHFTKAEDRGVRRANFAVIRDAPCPAALVEMGFISNSAEAMRLTSKSYQRLVATGIANGILSYRKALCE